eukprot:CAMPEP_0180557196 /NCGR_PEP_ID=MMETSP1037_2-20121125/1025_1 /TAXON_ID=632150 /ORGANISM="Azadinium spinosum, Strain 3D9" /LENGTH=64 /DNA_ID=CAMNT_0022573367 /DNA_START=342 /DNA_END=536 /DNA_ORIENTATION=+
MAAMPSLGLAARGAMLGWQYITATAPTGPESNLAVSIFVLNLRTLHDRFYTPTEWPQAVGKNNE